MSVSPAFSKRGDDVYLDDEWPREFEMTEELLAAAANTRFITRDGDVVIFELANAAARYRIAGRNPDLRTVTVSRLTSSKRRI